MNLGKEATGVSRLSLARSSSRMLGVGNEDLLIRDRRQPPGHLQHKMVVWLTALAMSTEARRVEKSSDHPGARQELVHIRPMDFILLLYMAKSNPRLMRKWQAMAALFHAAVDRLLARSACQTTCKARRQFFLPMRLRMAVH